MRINRFTRMEVNDNLDIETIKTDSLNGYSRTLLESAYKWNASDIANLLILMLNSYFNNENHESFIKLLSYSVAKPEILAVLADKGYIVTQDNILLLLMKWSKRQSIPFETLFRKAIDKNLFEIDVENENESTLSKVQL